MLAPNGAILGGGRAVAAVPSDWLGRPLPLLPFIDIAEQLDNGDWEVILHRRGCENCERAIARATQVRMAGPAGGPRLALIELPPYADGGGSSSAQLAVASRGKLSSDRVWAIETPLELGLRKGIVTNVVGASSVRAPSRQPLGGRTPTPIQSTDCGPACLYVVCAKLGKPEALDALRSMCATDATGTTMLALKQAALRLGYDARAFNGDFDILRCALEPAGIAVILHVRGSHFVVATLTRDGERGAVLVTDPAAGVFQGDEPFLRDDLRWTGDMLVIRKSEDAG
ncbi:MAG TPA: cysteine peptidase family C39 domain-containing protein [Pirellulales bacterium]